MNMRERLQAALKDAMRAKEAARLSTLRLINAAIKDRDIAARGDGQDAGVSDALSRPERIGARLFGIRAEGLIAGLSAAAARARLSGLLIGMELAAARPYWLGQAVAIVGSEGISASYSRALKGLGVEARLVKGGDAVLAGLAATRAKVTA